MSFIHETLVGHFDPARLFPKIYPLKPIRPLDIPRAQALLAEFPERVADHVRFEDGYAIVRWAPCHRYLVSHVHEFAARLARQQECVAAERPLYNITYPDDARRVQNEVALVLLAARG